MNTSHVFEATEADFQQKVMLRSREIPVVVEFYAPGYPGCPAVSKLAAEYGGRFELARVNLQKAQRLAMMLQIASVPTVYIFRDGQPVDGFQGDQPEDVVRQILDRFVPPPEADAIEMAEEALAAGRNDLALRYYKKALAENPKHGAALLGLARMSLGRGATKEAQGYIEKIEEGDPAYAAGQRLKGVFSFAQDAGDPASLEERVRENPRDVESWYRLGATRATRGQFAEACDAFLEVVKRDRGFRDDGARSALLAIFDLLGPEHDVAQRYRRRLASLLF